MMNGAEVLMRTLLANEVSVCFMNPGTSEMRFVSALDRVPGMRGVLCLFEGVCTGAADGYARMARRPAATLLHLGPGLGNGLANLHNARKARSPVVNVVGEHSTRHLQYDAPLTADIPAFAGTVSHWVRYLANPSEVGPAAAEAVCAACAPPGRIATLIVPADFSWSEAGGPCGAVVRPQPRAPDPAAIRAAARILRGAGPAALLLNGGALLERGLEAAGRIRQATGCRVFASRYCARISRGGARFRPQRIPYFPEPALAMLAGLKHMLLVEAQPPVSFFGYPATPSYLAPEDCAMHVLAADHQDGAAALEALAEECGARPPAAAPPAHPPAPPEDGALTPETIGRVVAALLPAGAILSEEAVSSGEQLWPPLAAAAPHEHLPVTGGSIGQALPVAVGAAIAGPGRKVVALEADGSGMYTLQALWTMARERLDVVCVIFANRRYRILDIEMKRTGGGALGPLANDMMDLTRPSLDWVKLAEGHGVAASRATGTAQFADLFGLAMKERGPRLIEAVL
jgi:acetolactate synthase-1/2/3 large subunit